MQQWHFEFQPKGISLSIILYPHADRNKIFFIQWFGNYHESWWRNIWRSFSGWQLCLQNNSFWWGLQSEWRSPKGNHSIYIVSTSYFSNITKFALLQSEYFMNILTTNFSNLIQLNYCVSIVKSSVMSWQLDILLVSCYKKFLWNIEGNRIFSHFVVCEDGVFMYKLVVLLR